MAGERELRSVSPFRLFWVGGAVGFLLDVVGHTIGVFRDGLPVTLANVAKYGARDLHAEAWLVCGGVCLAYGAFVVGQIVGAILEGRNNI